ncbi:MAG: PilZ domain-containing protein [Desulfobulbaceae bacterium]|nr:PilZ domain-containing protein [Desulfobulbaceae bacterium]
MKNDAPITRSFVKDNDITTIVCPSCYSAKTTSVKQFRNQQLALRVKCKCGHTFKIELEFRRQRRKSTELQGDTKLGTTLFDNTNVKVTDLSLGGARLEIQGIHDIQVGDTGTISFTLDDRKKSILLKNIVVRSVQENRIGCEFISDKAYEKDLGFYLRF